MSAAASRRLRTPREPSQPEEPERAFEAAASPAYWAERDRVDLLERKIALAHKAWGQLPISVLSTALVVRALIAISFTVGHRTWSVTWLRSLFDSV